MPAPARPPIGLHLARTAKAVNRAFEAALADAGGSLPSWLVLLSVKTGSFGNQNALAEAIGIRGATLTHHLNAMEASGLLLRRRDSSNRRVQHVELTPAGQDAFHRLRRAAVVFDQQLRGDLTSDELEQLTDLLDRLRANISGSERGHQRAAD